MLLKRYPFFCYEVLNRGRPTKKDWDVTWWHQYSSRISKSMKNWDLSLLRLVRLSGTDYSLLRYLTKFFVWSSFIACFGSLKSSKNVIASWKLCQSIAFAYQLQCSQCNSCLLTMPSEVAVIMHIQAEISKNLGVGNQNFCGGCANCLAPFSAVHQQPQTWSHVTSLYTWQSAP